MTGKLQNAGTNSKPIEPKFCCSLYFSQEMFLIVSETYMHYLLAKNKMKPNVRVIKWTKKTTGYESVQNTGISHSM
jgi:hypothetical protein